MECLLAHRQSAQAGRLSNRCRPIRDITGIEREKLGVLGRLTNLRPQTYEVKARRAPTIGDQITFANSFTTSTHEKFPVLYALEGECDQLEKPRKNQERLR